MIILNKSIIYSVLKTAKFKKIKREIFLKITIPKNKIFILLKIVNIYIYIILN